MNKSKFLKKSLAALLAILMVVAVIPLSAAASEESSPTPEPTPEPVALLAPTVTVNNRNAEKPQDAEGSYSATVEDATTVSIAWVPETDVTAKLLTERGVEVALPFYRLDLTKEAKLVNYDEATKVSTYQVTLIFQKGEEEAVKYPLVITSRTEAASDDVTIKSVKANQSYKISNDEYEFHGISGVVNNEAETITITLPLGWTASMAGFDSTNFGGNGPLNGNTQEQDAIVSQVFRPTASYSTVSYNYANGQGKVTVTARDSRTKNYIVNFVQEDALKDVSVTIGKAGDEAGSTYSVKSTYVDTDGVVTMVVPVPTKVLYNKGTRLTSITNVIINFNKLENTVRVEDPHNADNTSYITRNWAQNGAWTTPSTDEPIASGYNRFVFNDAGRQWKTDGTNNNSATVTGALQTYLSVKTEGNMEVNSMNVNAKEDGKKNVAFYQNLKIILEDETTASVSSEPKLVELQLNGYRAAWSEGKELGVEQEDGSRIVDINVDNEFEFSTGDGQHPARISTLVKGDAITIPAQTKGAGANNYWTVPDKVNAVARATEYASTNGTGKPSDSAKIDNVKTEGGSFVLRVFNGNKYKDYTIRINKPTRNGGANVSEVWLYHWNANEKKFDKHNSTYSTTNNNFNFEIAADLYKNEIVRYGELVTTGNNATVIKLQDQMQETTNFLSFNAEGSTDTSTAGVLNTALRKAFSQETVDGLVNFVNIEIGDANSNGNFPVYAVGVYWVNNHPKYTPQKLIGYLLKNGADTANNTWAVYTQEEAKTDTSLGVIKANGAQAMVTDPAKLTFNGTDTAGEGKWMTSIYELNSYLQDSYLVVKTASGAVVTPGGTLRQGLQTQVVGDSLWGADNYNGVYPTADKFYTELEEGYTKLGDWWSKKYTMTDSNTRPSMSLITPNKDMLYFTVWNGRRVNSNPHQTYTISFSSKNDGSAPSVDDKAELTFSTATNGVDEDLIFGGNTVTNAIIVKNSGVGAAVANAVNWSPKFQNNGIVNPASVDNNNAAYIGAVNEKNTFNFTVRENVGSNNKAKVVVIEVPEDFKANDKVAFTGITKSSGSKVYYDNAGTLTEMTNFNNVMVGGDTQEKQAAGTADGFTFTANDLLAWNNGTFIASNVSGANTLYVYSEKNADKGVKGKEDAIYYITVVRVADNTDDQLTGVSSSNDNVKVSLNQSRKVVTIQVPYSYNWVNARDTEDYDFTLDFTVDSGATLVDAYRDAAFNFRKQDPTNIWSVPQNFELADLVQQQQDLFSLSDKNLTYFVKGGELFVFNKNTGSETQITGMGNGVDDAFINQQWNLIKAHEAELRVYPETRANLNTYKLEVEVLPARTEAAITRVLVDETEATINGTNIVADMPNGFIATAVRLTISVSDMAKIVSVAGEPYEANKHYDITKPIEIVIANEDNTNQVVYTLSTETIEPTAEPSADPTEEPTAEPSADPSEEPSVEPSATPDIAKNYTDLDKVSSDDMRKEVVTALNLGLMNGTTPTTFAPKLTMKRYQFALVIARADLIAKDKDVTGENVDEKLVEMYPESYNFTFKDVSEKVELPAAAAAVQYCYDKGYVDGTDLAKGLFSPNAPILREQAAKIMVGWAGLDHDDTDLSDIPDGDKVSDWAKGYVKAAYEAEIIKGRANGDFDPRTALKREEGACLMVRTYEKYILNGEESEPTPTPEPTETPEPTSEPTEEPDPTAEPTEEPTAEPTVDPTEEPTAEPTVDPTEEPTAEPSTEPSTKPAE